MCAINGDGQSVEFISQLNTTVDSLLKNFEVPGASVAVIGKGKLIYSKGFGISDKVTDEHVKSSTIFPVASISKTVTAIGVLKLADKGLINIDSPYLNI